MKMNHEIIVVPLGPAGPELLTLQAMELLRDTSRRLVLRTAKHPVARWLREQEISFEAMDSFYDRYESFDELHAAMADFLWQEAGNDKITAGVMDPSTDGLVFALKASMPHGASLRVLPGVSVCTHCLASLPDRVRPEGGVQLLPAVEFLSHGWKPSLPLLITELDSALLAGEVKLKLSDLIADEQEVFFFPPAEEASRIVRCVPLYQLDQQKAYDHTAALFLSGSEPPLRHRYTFEDLAAIVSRLRAPDGCPWDRVQTHASLRPFMVEEAWEAVNAIEEGDMEHLADELGDVLFQVFIHASIGESFDEFTMTDIITHICEKMISRHPHVFAAGMKESAEQVSAGWEARKRAETGSRTVGETLNDVSQTLPSLKYAIKMHKKLAQIPALRRPPEEIAREIRQLSGELLQHGEISPRHMSELLMKCTELCWRTDQDAEILLHAEVNHVKQTYQEAEKMIFRDKKSPESLTFQQLCVYLSTVEGGDE